MNFNYWSEKYHALPVLGLVQDFAIKVITARFLAQQRAAETAFHWTTTASALKDSLIKSHVRLLFRLTRAIFLIKYS